MSEPQTPQAWIASSTSCGSGSGSGQSLTSSFGLRQMALPVIALPVSFSQSDTA